MEEQGGRAGLLALVQQRIKEGWEVEEIAGRGTLIYPPEEDRKRYWCAMWKVVKDAETDTTYLYPHWIGED
jgi:hypothetical protein